MFLNRYVNNLLISENKKLKAENERLRKNMRVVDMLKAEYEQCIQDAKKCRKKYADAYDKVQGNALFYRSRGILMDHIQMMTKYIHAND